MKIVEEREGARITHEFEEMTPEKRPQDVPRNGGSLKFETAEHGGACPDTMPQALVVKDSAGRSCTYLAVADDLPPEQRPQDTYMDGSRLSFTVLEHGGEYPDDMPQLIRLTDREGRSCDYVPITVDGRVVDSKGFCLETL